MPNSTRLKTLGFFVLILATGFSGETDLEDHPPPLLGNAGGGNFPWQACVTAAPLERSAGRSAIVGRTGGPSRDDFAGVKAARGRSRE